MPFPGNYPVVLSVDGVESAFLERSQLEGEPWPQFLQPALFSRLEVVPVVAEKDKVSLVVKGHGPLAFELGVVVEQAGQHPSHCVSKPSREVIQDHFRPVFGDVSEVSPNLPGDLDVGQLEVGCGAIGQVAATNFKNQLYNCLLKTRWKL